MDSDIHHLVFHYLLKARELAISGQEHRAIVQLGLCPELIPLLKRLSTARLEALAKTNVTCFSIRFPGQFWRDLLQEDAGDPIPEALFLHLLTSSAMGGDGDDLAAKA